MSGRNWRFVITAVGCLIASAIIWAVFAPTPPKLPAHTPSQTQAADYQAGGSDCRPKNLALLRGQKAATERERCAEAAEQHRLQANDLTQQARAADATQSGALTAYEATRIALGGLIAGFLTLVAAIFAAYYARRAYVHSSDAFQMSSRPFVFIEKIEVVELDENGIYQIIVTFKNCGATPAINFDSDVYWQLADPHETPEPVFGEDSMRMPVIPPNFTRKAIIAAVLTTEQRDKLLSYELMFWLHTRVRFDSRFRRDKIIVDSRHTTGDDFLNGVFYLSREILPPAPLLEQEHPANDGKRTNSEG